MNANVKKKNSENSEEIKVVSIKRDVQTKEVAVTLQSKYRGNTVVKTIPRDTINVMGLRGLSKYGFPTLKKDDIDNFIAYYEKNEDSFPIENIHHTVGWHEIGGKDYFLHRKALADNKVKKSPTMAALTCQRKVQQMILLIFLPSL